MTFKFVAKNRETGKTGSVTVKANTESSARQKLTLGGYDVVSLVRVTNNQETSLQIHLPSAQMFCAPPAPKSGFLQLLQTLVTQIDHFIYHGLR